MKNYKIFLTFFLIALSVKALAEDSRTELIDKNQLIADTGLSFIDANPVKEESLSGEFNSSQLALQNSSISSTEQSDFTKINVYLFGQSEVVLPGGGLAIRGFKNSHGIEASGSFFIFPLMAGLKLSTSYLYNFNTNGKGFYLGQGVGALFPFTDDGLKTVLFIPVFLGYQTESFFIDFGLDLALPVGYFMGNTFLPLPVLRTGFSF